MDAVFFCRLNIFFKMLLINCALFSNYLRCKCKANITKWQEKEFANKYFEMFAIVNDTEMVGMISLYQHSPNVISCGPEIFECYRKRGFAGNAMMLAMKTAKSKGYKLVLQQIRVDNIASIALHKKLGFETDGYVYKKCS